MIIYFGKHSTVHRVQLQQYLLTERLQNRHTLSSVWGAKCGPGLFEKRHLRGRNILTKSDTNQRVNRNTATAPNIA